MNPTAELMQNLIADISYSIRLLAKSRGFTIAALLTLAVCIGANSAIFSVVNSVLIRPLPYPESDRIVTFHNSYPNAGAAEASTSIPDYFDRLEGLTAFEEMALYQNRGLTIGESGRPERMLGTAVTPSYFRVLRVQPARGRSFTDADTDGNARKAILSFGLWQERYGGRGDVIGQDIRVNGEPYEIVGVMPRGFGFNDDDTRLWVPFYISVYDRSDERRHSNNQSMIGRLKDGHTVVVAQQQLDALNKRIDERYPQFHEILKNAGFRSYITEYRSELVADVKDTLWLLQAGVFLVLLIGCVNLANLLLVRSISRNRELATRAALGAGRTRLVRQLLTESIVLSLVGGLIGLGLGYALTRVFMTVAPELLPRGGEVQMDWTVALGALVLSFIAGLLFGTIPVVRVMRTDLSSVFREEGRTGTASRGALLLRGGLVVTQVALAFALLIATGLIIASFNQTLGVDTGFKAERLLTASVALPPTKYANDESRRLAMQELTERIRTIPGVQSVGYADVIPFSGDFNSSVLTAEGYVAAPGESLYSPANSVVSEDYFAAMGIELVRGRYFNATDDADGLPVLIIDEALAARFWPGQDPIGKRAYQGVAEITPDDTLEMRTIVGVVRNVRLAGFRGEQPEGHYYWPAAQDPLSRAYLAIRTNVDPASKTGAVRAAAIAIDPDLPVYDDRTMEERVSASLATDRLRMFLLIGFAAIALFLAGIGLYGVLAYSVAQRTGELCIRMALGSSTREVFGLVLSHGLRLTALGLAIGAVLSLVGSRVLHSLLFGVTPYDPRVFGAVIAILTLIAVAACFIPARRATRLQPMNALRTAG